MWSVDTLNDVASRWVELAWSVVWQSTILATIVALVVLAFRRSSPEVRYWLWQIVAIKMLLMPFWTVAVEVDAEQRQGPAEPAASRESGPAVAMIGPEDAESKARAPGVEGETSTDAQEPIDARSRPRVGGNLAPPRTTTDVNVPERPHVPPVTPSRRESRPVPSSSLSAIPLIAQIRWQGWLVLFWLTIVAAQAAGMVIQRIRLGRLLSSARPADPRLAALVAETAAALGLSRAPRTVLIDGDGSPFVYGVLRPVVAMPAAVREAFAEGQLRQILLHELAHIKRRDLLWGWISAVARTLYFFHPVAHWVCSRIRLERELACDRVAMSASGADVAEYAETLVRAVSFGSRPVVLQTGAVHCGCSSQLSPFWKRRIAMLPSIRQSRPIRLRSWVCLLAAGALIGLVPTFFGVATSAEESQNQSESGSTETEDLRPPEVESTEPPAKSPDRRDRRRERREHSAAQPGERELNARDAAVPREASGADVPYSMGGGASLDLIALANSYFEAVADVEVVKQEVEMAERSGHRDILPSAARRLQHVERRAKLLQRITEVAIRATQQELDLLKDETKVLEGGFRQGEISGREVFASRRKLHQAEARLEILQTILSASQTDHRDGDDATPAKR